MKDLEAPPAMDGRIRRPGAGRPTLRQRDPELEAALDALLDPDVRGDPESPLRWTCKSTGQLALALTRGGHPVSATTVGTMLREAGYSLQANVKTKEGTQHPGRDAQFRYLNEQARQFRDAGLPVVSVDCKKKELVGEFKNGGREWTPKGEPVEVRIHDFITEQGKAIPYGIYDIERNVGWVNVGQDHETAAFAVESLRRWWRGDGTIAYPAPTNSSSAPTVAAAMATGRVCGRPNSGVSRRKPDLPSPSVTCHLGSARGRATSRWQNYVALIRTVDSP